MPITLLAVIALAGGQSSVPSLNRRHTIVGARIEVGNGTVIEKGNLVIENGIITAVGPDVKAPAGAVVLDGTGLTVTPGFIDAWTTKGLALPAAQPDQDAAPSVAEYAPANMREANRKGIRPELQARALLAITDDVAKPYRQAGFTTLMIAPGSGYLSGRGTLANLSGRPSRESVVVSETVMAANFDGEAGGDAYPGSLLGRVAQVRQAWLDAQWQRTVAETYRNGGPLRPASDPALEALLPALDGRLPVGFTANTPSEIDRCLSMAAEFNLHPWIVGGAQAYRRIETLKTTQTPVVLGMNFGESPADVSGEEASRRAERKRAWDEGARNAKALSDAGIPFSLTTQGSKDPDDFLRRLRWAVAAGLPREAAFKALTVEPARLLGVQNRLGTLEVGKIANIVVRDGDFILEKTKVKMLYVDGYRIDPAAKPLPPAQKPAPVRDGGDR